MQRPAPSTEERLVLAQVIHLIGASDWHNVSSSLMRMSTDRGKQMVLTPSDCEGYWMVLMRQMGVNLTDPVVLERVRAPQAPENFELVRRLFFYRLNELHHQILEKENTFRHLSNELSEIRSGAWDEKLAPKKPPPEPVVSIPAATASSSSSQLSSIDSPMHTPTVAPTTQQQGQDEMEIDGADITVTQKDEDIKEDMAKAGSPGDSSLDEDDDAEEKPKGKGQVKEEDEDEDAEGDEDEDEDEEKVVEKARPARGLRNRKVPVLEPLEIPVVAATSPKSSRKGKSHRPSDSTSQPSARGRRRGGPESAKPPHSPAAASFAGTFESPATPAAATDENVSVVDDGGRRRSTRGHKRKASEMDVDLPVPSISKQIRDRSTTVEDEPMTPAVQPGSSGRFSNPKLKQTMTKFVNMLISNKDAEIFRRPVKKKDAPDYEQAVQHPTDLSTIQRATKAGQIVSWDELERELRKMLANCCVYNRPGTGAYKTARLMLNEVEGMLEVAREGAGDGK